MTRSLLVPALCVLASLGGCAGRVAPPAAEVAILPWRAIATPADRDRLSRWRDAWVTALARARTAGGSAAIDEQGALFAYDSALADPVPPPGDYRCRVFKLGAKVARSPEFVAYPAFACRVGTVTGATTLEKLGGSQRHVGRIYADTSSRAVFLGTLVLGDEQRPVDYGRDSTRDLAGWMERVGPVRWRVAMPYPAFESTLDVLELVPAG